MKQIIFNLKYRWYAEIANGMKAVEYREVKPYWTKRLKNLVGDVPTKGHDVNPVNILAVFRNGYGKPSAYGSATPDIVRRVMWIDVGPCPYNGWDGDYYRINFEREDYK